MPDDSTQPIQHGGLRSIDPARARKFRQNYQKLKTLLKRSFAPLGPALFPTSPASTPSEMVTELFEKEGYYIGKRALRKLLDEEFEDYDGIRIYIGLNEDPRDLNPATRLTNGELVFIIKGAWKHNSPDRGVDVIDGERVDKRFFGESPNAFMAGDDPGGGAGGLSTFPVPPNGR